MTSLRSACTPDPRAVPGSSGVGSALLTKGEGPGDRPAGLTRRSDGGGVREVSMEARGGGRAMEVFGYSPVHGGQRRRVQVGGGGGMSGRRWLRSLQHSR